MANKLTKITEKGYTVISNEVFNQNILAMKEMGLLCKILSVSEEWNFSIEGFAKCFEDGKAAVRSAAQGLEEKGYLKRIQCFDENGRFCGYDWQVSDQPIFLTEKSPSSDFKTTEKKTTKNRTTTNKSTKKSTQTSNKATSTKKTTTSFNQSINHQEDTMTNEESETCRESLKEHINYSKLLDDNIAKDLFEICIEIVDNTEDMTIKSRIAKLDHEDLLRIAQSIRDYEKPIKSYKKFMVQCLLNESVITNTRSSNQWRKQDDEKRSNSSFDTDDFFYAAVARGMENYETDWETIKTDWETIKTDSNPA